jgi:hypothetical protein
MFVNARAAIGHGRDRKEVSNLFTVGAILAGFVSGLPIYYGVRWVLNTIGYRVNVGHGEVLVAAPIFNLILGLGLAMVGRMLLQWRPIKW